MTYEWTLVVDLGVIAGALALATLIRAKVRFFQKYLIPNALTAGFFLLLFYNLVAPAIGLGTGNLGGLVFHLLNISFISMSLKEGSMKGAGKRIFATAVSIISHYAIQVAIGLGITALFIISIKPDLFLNFGFFLALGYGLGPGQSFAIGKAWEPSGFANAGNIGLIFAAIGYVWGCIGGVWLINLGRKRGWVDADTHVAIEAKSMRTGVFGRNEKGPVGAHLRTDTEAIDSMSFHLLLVFAVYLIAYLVLKLVTWPLLAYMGNMGKQLSDTLWGISFVFAAVIGMLVKKVMKMLKIEHLLDEGSFNRIAGGSVDFMLAAAVGAISLVVVSQYWLPIAAVAIVGGVVTTFTCLWMSSRLFDDHQFEPGAHALRQHDGDALYGPRAAARGGPRVQDPGGLRLRVLERHHLRAGDPHDPPDQSPHTVVHDGRDDLAVDHHRGIRAVPGARDPGLRPARREEGVREGRESLVHRHLGANPEGGGMGIYKSYDIRGVWGRDWDAGVARAIGRALPGVLEAREVCVGRDARLSSDELFAAFAGGVREAGAGIADIGRCDTPAVYFATARYGFDAGVMITASHNPAEYNGLKISRRDAVPVGYGSGLERLEAAAAAGGTAAPAPGTLRALDIQADYLAHLARFAGGIEALKVVVDYSNGTGSVYFPAVLAGLPVTVVPMYDQPDGRFPNHAPNPLVEANLDALKARVLAEHADLGLCFDGDADRVMVVDERGRFVSADLLIGVLARYWFTMHPERLAGGSRVVSYDIRSSRGVVEELERLGAEPRMCKVGHVFAKQLLRQTGGIMGGELAGHYYFRENYFCDSAFIAAQVLLAVLSAERRPLSEVVAEIGRYAFSGEINFEVADGARVVEAVRREFPEGKLVDLDGIRIDFPTWWFNLRTSNTEPLLRLVVEAQTPAELAVRVREVKGRIEDYA